MGSMNDGRILAMIAASSKPGTPEIRSEAPPYASSVNDMKDTSRVYVGPNGNLWTYMKTSSIQKEYTNRADPSSADWVSDSRLGSSGVSSGAIGTVVSNYISCKKGDVIRVQGFNIGYLAANGNTRVHFLDANLNILDATVFTLMDDAFVHEEAPRQHSYKWFYTVGTTGNGETYSTIADKIAYMRFCGTPQYTADDIIITVNEEIRETEVSGYEWSDTGVAYAHYAMTDSDYARVTDGVLDRLDVSYVSADKVLTVGRYTLRYDGEGIADIGVTV